MIQENHYGRYHATRPGHLPEPLKPAHTIDPQEYVDLCLQCPIPGGCKPYSPDCLLKSAPSVEIGKHAKRVARDKKIRDMINSGQYSDRAISRELRISRETVRAAKKRLRERGEIN